MADLIRHIDELVERIALFKDGRPIEMRAVDLEGSVSGSCITGPDRILILYPRGSTALHTRHIKLHELGHAAMHDQDATAISDLLLEVAQRAAPNLDPEVVRYLLSPPETFHRSAYDDRIELEAELFATMLGEKVAASPAFWAPRDPVSLSVYDRLGAFCVPGVSYSGPTI